MYLRIVLLGTRCFGEVLGLRPAAFPGGIAGTGNQRRFFADKEEV